MEMNETLQLLVNADDNLLVKKQTS